MKPVTPLLRWAAFALLAGPLVAQTSPPVLTVPTGPLGLQPAPAASGGSARSETVGSWTVTPPDAASLIAGGGSIWGWLNTTNAAVSVHDAFSGAGIVEDGFANADSGTTIEVSFLAGVTNGPGADLVLFDAVFDSGTYAVSSSHDGFVATTSPSFAASGESRAYYYEMNAGGPFTAAVHGAEIDLSAIGVPAGTSVAAIRFTTTDGAGDPLGVGALVHGPTLEVHGLVAGLTASIIVTGATPGGLVGVGYSLTGPGPSTVPAGPCGPVTVLLSPPIGLLPLMTASAGGVATTGAAVPPGAAGHLVFFHGLDLGSCALTNPLALVVL